MCLAIPAKITNIGDDNLATVDILGATREISLDLTPHAAIGSYVLVHAGFAIEVVDEQFAQETIDLIKQFPELAEDEAAGIEDGSLSGGSASEAAPASPTDGMRTALASLADEL